MLNADNTQTKIEVEMFESKTTHSGSTFYYRFGATWYKYINNRFVYSPTPPAFYTGSQSATSFQPLQKFTTYNSGYSSSSLSSSSNYVVANHASTKSQFNPPSQYTIARTSSSGSSQQSAYNYYKPVATDQVTITETVVAAAPVMTMISHTSNDSKMFRPVESVPNSDATMFGGGNF